jgi:hypothetical protein
MSYSTVFIVAYRFAGPGGIISTAERLSHWKLWLHTPEHRDYFFHVTKEGGHPVVSPVPDFAWENGELQKMRKRCRFIGLTDQNHKDIEEHGKRFWTPTPSNLGKYSHVNTLRTAKRVCETFGDYHTIDNNCQTYVHQLVEAIPLLDGKWHDHFNEPDQTLDRVFGKKRSNYKAASEIIRGLFWVNTNSNETGEQPKTIEDFVNMVESELQDMADDDWVLL